MAHRLAVRYAVANAPYVILRLRRDVSESEKVRVSKLMAAQGLCSRREADTYIERGWVFVDGERVSELGTKIFPNQRITLSRAAASEQTARVTILINKPIG